MHGDSSYNDNNGVYCPKTEEPPNNDKARLHHQQPVKLQPSWEENNLPEEELNFKNLSMADATLEVSAPPDKMNLIYLIFIIHGIGPLTPWNMFINAGSYFTGYKLSPKYIGYEFAYLSNFLQIITFAAQIPNVIFNWLNIYVQLGGDLTNRIVYSIATVVVCFLITVFLAMIDTSSWAEAFFWITVILVVILGMANGVYQNTVFGMAAKLPYKYTGAIILGNNISGTFIAVVNIVSTYLTNEPKTAAIYFFITALFVLFICFDTYFALPLNRFYRHYDLKAKKMALQRKRDNQIIPQKIPYMEILKKCRMQFYNVFCVLFVTLCIFPSMHANIQPSSKDFFLQQPYYTTFTCFLTFNLFAMIGSAAASMYQWPTPRYLWIPVTIRLLYIPFYLFANYHADGVIRILPILFMNDYVYWVVSITMALTSGYLSSLAMMYTPRLVDEKYASTAGMFAGAFLMTGIFTGIVFSFLWPWAISHIGY